MQDDFTGMVGSISACKVAGRAVSIDNISPRSNIGAEYLAGLGRTLAIPTVGDLWRTRVLAVIAPSNSILCPQPDLVAEWDET